MSRVSASEFDLLSITRALVNGQGASVGWLLRSERMMPAVLSPQALKLLKDLLAKGVILRLCQWGGWRDTQSLVGAKDGAKDGNEVDTEVLSGRAWQRHPELALDYSDFTIRLLVALTRDSVRSKLNVGRRRSPKTTGDELVALLALDAAKENECGSSLAALKEIQKSALCWLMYPDLLGLEVAPPQTLDFSSWLSGAGSVVLETISERLTERWLFIEQGKSKIVSLTKMRDVGLAQAHVLDQFLTQVKKAGREDLACFLIRVAAELARNGRGPNFVAGRLEAPKSMLARSDAMNGAAAFYESLKPIHQWVREKRTLRFFDDDFDSAQLLLKEWEALGDIGYQQLQSLAGELRSFSSVEGIE